MSHLKIVHGEDMAALPGVSLALLEHLEKQFPAYLPMGRLASAEEAFSVLSEMQGYQVVIGHLRAIYAAQNPEDPEDPEEVP